MSRGTRSARERAFERATPVGGGRSRVSRILVSGRVMVTVLALLASLMLVTWRQSRALDALGALDEVHRSRGLAEAERASLQRRIQYLESRGRVVPEARRRLGMHNPDASEIIILRGETP